MPRIFLNLKLIAMPRYNSQLFHPLDWPTGYPRTESPKQARLRSTFAVSRQHLEAQIAHFGGSSIIISSDWQLTSTGTLKATTRQPEDTGVSVFFTRDGKEVCMACDQWDSCEDNLRAIGLTLEALRGIDRWGVSEIIGRIFAGFMALPESASGLDNVAWWDFLLISVDAG